jgi:hypothetical protein
MIQPTAPITVTLEAQQWEQVLRILDETPAPHRIIHPLIVEIQRQCMAADKPNVAQLHEAGC